MNTRILTFLACALMVPVSADAAYGPPVIETGSEFFVYGDFNGDGTRSYLVIDRASGGMRQANTLSGGGLIMTTTRVSGVTDITGAAVGRFTVDDHDTIAVTSPLANRVRVCGPFGAHFDGWPAGVGPRHVTGVALPGGTAGLDDLVATTEINRAGAFGPYQQSFMLNQTLDFSSLLVRYPDDLPESPLAVRFDDGEPAYYAELRNNGGSLDFNVYDTTNAAVPMLTSCSDVVPGSRVVYGNLVTTDSTSEFVFHVPGSNRIQLSSVDRNGLLTAPVTRDLSAAADLVQPVEGGGGLWLAALTRGGLDLHVYQFGGADVPQLVQVIAPPAGRTWSGIIPAAGGRWFAASSSGGGSSSSFRRFDYSGGKAPFQAAGDYDLELLFPEELGSDVLLFTGEPFLEPNPILRGRYRAGGWTSNLNDDPSFPSGMDASFEVWRSPELGLGDPVYRYLGIRPLGVTHGLSNQISADTSFYSLDSPIGGVPDLVTFDPESGPQTTGIEVTLEADDPGTTIYYAIGASTRWYPYSSPIGPIAADTTIRAYASDGGVKSPIQSAIYTFPSYPGDVDSDGDSVPDFVEEAHGLDPLESGLDSDLDGVPDLQEILAGTDPTDDQDTPDALRLRAYTRHFDLRVEPMSHPGVSHGEPLTLLSSLDPGPSRNEVGTWLNVNRPDGTPEVEEVARGKSGNPPVQLVDLNRTVETPPLFWVAGTPSRFRIDVLAGEKDDLRGRGVFRLLDYEAPDLYPLPRPELSGTSGEQVSQWVAAVRDHFSSKAQVEVGGRVSLFETVDLLLAEHALGRIFHSRGRIRDPRLSLTPFRGDATPPSGRRAANEEWLAELSSAAFGDDGYDWGALLSFIRAASLPKGPPREPLDDLAREFYRIGYHAFDDSRQPLNLAPFDALREFMDTRQVPREYDQLRTIPTEIVERAVVYLTAFSGALPERNYTSVPLMLVARPGFFREPWIVLERAATGGEYWLADEQGQPLREPAGFRILPGFEFLATGHPSPRTGGGTLLMVDSISLVDAPMPGITDSDANALADNWEAFYFGILGNDPFSDSDFDGYMTLQEMFETTDPRYGPDFPAVPPVDLRLGQPDFHHLGGQDYSLGWRWPATYQDRVHFFVEGAPDLQGFFLLEDNITATSGDLFETMVDGAGNSDYFFRVGFGLR